MSELQTLEPKTRSALQQPAASLRAMGVSPDSIPLSVGTYIIPIGIVGVDGYRLDRFWAVTGTLLAPDGTNYYTFKPWLSRPATLGGMEKVYLGTPRSTLRLSLVAGQPLQMHEEQTLGVQVPKFSTVGVDVVVTGTPSGATTLVRPLLQADFSHV